MQIEEDLRIYPELKPSSPRFFDIDEKIALREKHHHLSDEEFKLFYHDYFSQKWKEEDKLKEIKRQKALGIEEELSQAEQEEADEFERQQVQLIAEGAALQKQMERHQSNKKQQQSAAEAEAKRPTEELWQRVR